MNLGMYAIVGTRMNEIKAIKKMKREKKIEEVDASKAPCSTASRARD